MNKKNITPRTTKPVVRFSQGTQIDQLTELSEEMILGCVASYDYHFAPYPYYGNTSYPYYGNTSYPYYG
ncbi:MAG: DUF5837 family cyanobactin class RiPP [Rivularia sp. (in: cyanobacteria)]